MTAMILTQTTIGTPVNAVTWKKRKRKATPLMVTASVQFAEAMNLHPLFLTKKATLTLQKFLMQVSFSGMLKTGQLALFMMKNMTNITKPLQVRFLWMT